MANELIKLNSDDELSGDGIRIERKRRKRKGGFWKKLLGLSILLLICIGIYKLYPFLKNIEIPSLDFSDKLDTPPDKSDNNTTENPTDYENISDDSQDNTNDNESSSNDSNQSNDPEQEETIPTGHYKIINGRSEYEIINNSACEVDFSKECTYKPVSEIYDIFGTGAPVVLITHFSSRECYSNGKSYTPQGIFYSNEGNIGDIGKLITSELNSLGINTIHLNEVYASGSIYSSREEYEESLRKTLVAFPSIEYVINISRDIYINEDMTMTKNTITSNDKQCAQIGLTVGTNYSEITELQEKNIIFTSKLASHINSKYDGLISSTEISRFDLSQCVEPICFNLDIGSYANTYNEACNASSLFANSFFDMIY